MTLVKSTASQNQKGLARFQAMHLPVDSYFERVLPRRKQDLPDFENISGQNKLVHAAHPRKDVPLVCALFRGHYGYALSNQPLKAHLPIGGGSGEQFMELGE